MNIPKQFETVNEFMTTFEQEVKHSPEIPSKDVCKLRVALLEEEVGELKQALKDKNIVEVLDALIDIEYVLNGTFLEKIQSYFLLLTSQLQKNQYCVWLVYNTLHDFQAQLPASLIVP